MPVTRKAGKIVWFHPRNLSSLLRGRPPKDKISYLIYYAYGGSEEMIHDGQSIVYFKVPSRKAGMLMRKYIEKILHVGDCCTNPHSQHIDGHLFLPGLFDGF